MKMTPLLIAAVVIAAGSLPPCQPHEQAGAILSVIGTMSPDKQAPYLSRQQKADTPGSNQLLCPGDTLVNPRSSGVSIRYRLSGHEAKVLAPGDPPVNVPASGFQEQMAMLSQRWKSLFDYLAEAQEGVRGGSDNDTPIYPLPAKVFAVASWGPLVVA